VDFAGSGRQPVPQELHEQLLLPFIEATGITLREWASTEVFESGTYQIDPFVPFGDIAVVLELSSPIKERLVLGFPERTAMELAGRILSRAPEEVERDLVHDCMREIVNVLAGQTKAILQGTPYHFSFTTPTVVCPASGASILGEAGLRCLMILFASEVGEFAVQVFVKA
jgi:CheY-specific phosphatase CheX